MLEVLKNEDLKKYCTFKIGGTAKYVFICYSETDLIDAVYFAIKTKHKFKVIGFGANLLFSDEFYDGIIIVNRSKEIEFNNNSVSVESGVPVISLIKTCAEKSLGGIENLSGIPSTVGGAVVNNLGAFGCEFSHFVDSVECYDFNDLKKKIILKKDACKFDYRDSIFKHNNLLITKVILNLKSENKTLIQQKIIETIKRKSNSQPLNLPSAGSVFKRNGDIIPAKIIDQQCLKGKQVGSAQISPKHAGFIVNLGGATSYEVKKLIEEIQSEIKNKHNIILEPEIEFVE